MRLGDTISEDVRTRDREVAQYAPYLEENTTRMVGMPFPSVPRYGVKADFHFWHLTSRNNVNSSLLVVALVWATFLLLVQSFCVVEGGQLLSVKEEI